MNESRQPLRLTDKEAVRDLEGAYVHGVDARLTCRCVAVADGWVRHPINVYGECVVCRGRVFSTVAGRLAGRPEGPVSRARNTRVPSGRSAGCCGDPSDCVCEEAA